MVSSSSSFWPSGPPTTMRRVHFGLSNPDYVLVYQGCEFHVHRDVLRQSCTYFKHLMSEPWFGVPVVVPTATCDWPEIDILFGTPGHASAPIFGPWPLYGPPIKVCSRVCTVYEFTATLCSLYWPEMVYQNSSRLSFKLAQLFPHSMYTKQGAQATVHPSSTISVHDTWFAHANMSFDHDHVVDWFFPGIKWLMTWGPLDGEPVWNEMFARPTSMARNLVYLWILETYGAPLWVVDKLRKSMWPTHYIPSDALIQRFQLFDLAPRALLTMDTVMYLALQQAAFFRCACKRLKLASKKPPPFVPVVMREAENKQDNEITDSDEDDEVVQVRRDQQTRLKRKRFL